MAVSQIFIICLGVIEVFIGMLGFVFSIFVVVNLDPNESAIVLVFIFLPCVILIAMGLPLGVYTLIKKPSNWLVHAIFASIISFVFFFLFQFTYDWDFLFQNVWISIFLALVVVFFLLVKFR